MKYLEDWEASVDARQGFDTAQKKKMLLSTETLDGIRMTSKKRSIVNYNTILANTSSFIAYSFVELVKYLFTVPGVEVFSAITFAKTL